MKVHSCQRSMFKWV